MSKDLRDLGIKATTILDSAVAYLIENIDAVIIGAEAVCKDGGIINKVSDYLVCVD